MTGVVIKVVPDRGFGFIKGSDGVDRFFHVRDVSSQLANAVDFERMRELFVEFDNYNRNDRPAAINVRPAGVA